MNSELPTDIDRITLTLSIVVRSPRDLHRELHRNLDHADVNEYRNQYREFLDEFENISLKEFSDFSTPGPAVTVSESPFQPKIGGRPMGGGVPPFETVVNIGIAFTAVVNFLQAVVWAGRQIRKIYGQSFRNLKQEDLARVSNRYHGLPLIDSTTAISLCARDVADRHCQRLIGTPTVELREFEEGPFLRTQFFVEVPGEDARYCYLLSQYGLPLDHYAKTDDCDRGLEIPQDFLGISFSSD